MIAIALSARRAHAPRPEIICAWLNPASLRPRLRAVRARESHCNDRSYGFMIRGRGAQVARSGPQPRVESRRCPSPSIPGAAMRSTRQSCSPWGIKYRSHGLSSILSRRIDALHTAGRSTLGRVTPVLSVQLLDHVMCTARTPSHSPRAVSYHHPAISSDDELSRSRRGSRGRSCASHSPPVSCSPPDPVLSTQASDGVGDVRTESRRGRPECAENAHSATRPRPLGPPSRQ